MDKAENGTRMGILSEWAIGISDSLIAPRFRLKFGNRVYAGAFEPIPSAAFPVPIALVVAEVAITGVV